MTKKSATGKKYFKRELEKTRERASEIWKGKCQALNAALDDWLRSEQELKAATGPMGKSFHQYTNEESAKIKERTQAIRKEKMKSLRAAFGDWVEAGQGSKGGLKKRSASMIFLTSGPTSRLPVLPGFSKKVVRYRAGMFNDVLERQYVEINGGAHEARDGALIDAYSGGKP